MSSTGAETPDLGEMESICQYHERVGNSYWARTIRQAIDALASQAEAEPPPNPHEFLNWGANEWCIKCGKPENDLMHTRMPPPNTDVHLAVPDDEGKEPPLRPEPIAWVSLHGLQDLRNNQSTMVYPSEYHLKTDVPLYTAPVETQPASASIPPKAAVQDKTERSIAERVTKAYEEGLIEGQQEAQAGAEPLRQAARNLLEACYSADVQGDLAGEIDGSLLDAVAAALAEPQAEPRNQDQELQDHPAVPASGE